MSCFLGDSNVLTLHVGTAAQFRELEATEWDKFKVCETPSIKVQEKSAGTFCILTEGKTRNGRNAPLDNEGTIK